jgi:hypothetical protein
LADFPVFLLAFAAMGQAMIARSALLATLVSLCAACAGDEDYADRQIRYVSIGMTGADVARVLGSTGQESQTTYESREFTVYIQDDAASVELKGPEPLHVAKVDGEIKVWRGGIPVTDETSYLKWPVQPGMTRRQVEAIMGPPVQCRMYAGDARAGFYVCFRSGRVVSKRVQGVPII